MKKYYCMHCKQECGFFEIDEGIGVYEYWGAKGVDINMVAYSDCCEAELAQDQPEEIE